MMITSADCMHGNETVKRLGPVSGEYVLEEKTYKAIVAEMRQYDEIRTQAYEKEIEKAKENVIDQMKKKAEALGANAIISFSLHQEIISYGKQMLIAGKGIAASIDELE